MAFGLPYPDFSLHIPQTQYQIRCEHYEQFGYYQCQMKRVYLKCPDSFSPAMKAAVNRAWSEQGWHCEIRLWFAPADFHFGEGILCTMGYGFGTYDRFVFSLAELGSIFRGTFYDQLLLNQCPGLPTNGQSNLVGFINARKFAVNKDLWDVAAFHKLGQDTCENLW